MKTVFFLLFITLTTPGHSQTIGDQIGSVSCSYLFYTNGIKIEPLKQLLIQRAESKSQISQSENQSYGVGFAYTEWHLEFVTSSPIQTRKKFLNEESVVRRKYCIQYSDKDGKLLAKVYQSSDGITQWSGGTETEPIYTYSLDLIDAPLVLLDDIVFLDIVYIE